MSNITSIKSFQVLDSRGSPTLITMVRTKNSVGVASVPSGASTGKYEAYELRDNNSEFFGKGVNKAINNVNNIISKKVIGMSVFDQEKIDYSMKELDNTPNKSKIGANAILSVSMAVAKCAAHEQRKELYEYLGGLKFFPTPMLNIINGGKHAGNNLAIQESMIIPDTNSFNSDMRISSEIYHELKNILIQKYGKTSVNVGDEGGFAPNISNVEESFDLILKAANNLGYEKKIGLGIDAAASEFYIGKKYHINGKYLSKEELIEYYKSLVKKYPLWSIEDPFEQNDFETTAILNNELKTVQVVGDDLLVTNVDRIKESISHKSCTALLLKINQIGTLTEAKAACNIAHKNKMNVIVSHRSGDTCDTFISDLCLGWKCEMIKSGAPCRGERVSKYNRLMVLEQIMEK